MPVRFTTPSTVTVLADGAEAVAPAGTLVKPPATNVDVEMIDNRPGEMTRPDAPNRLVLIAENGASSTVPLGAMTLPLLLTMLSATSEARPPDAVVNVAGRGSRTLLLPSVSVPFAAAIS